MASKGYAFTGPTVVDMDMVVPRKLGVWLERSAYGSSLIYWRMICPWISTLFLCKDPKETWDLVADPKYLCWCFMWFYLDPLRSPLSNHISHVSLEYLPICSPYSCTLSTMVDAGLTYFLQLSFPFSCCYPPRSASGGIIDCLFSVLSISDFFFFYRFFLLHFLV